MNEPVCARKPGRTCILWHIVILYWQVCLPFLSACRIESLQVAPCQPSVLSHMRVALARKSGLERPDGERSHSEFQDLQKQLSVIPSILQRTLHRRPCSTKPKPSGQDD